MGRKGSFPKFALTKEAGPLGGGKGDYLKKTQKGGMMAYQTRKVLPE